MAGTNIAAHLRAVRVLSVARLGAFVTISIFLTESCTAPTLRLGQLSGATTSGSAPTVADLVDHLACELAETYVENTAPGVEAKYGKALPDGQSHAERWKHLYDANFVVAVDLNLMVTRAEGFSPLISGTVPLTGAGHRLPYSASASATFNDTLALGFQFNTTDDRNVEQDFVVDIRNLIDQYEAVGVTDDAVIAAFQNGRHALEKESSFPYCLLPTDGPKPSRKHAAPAQAISGSPLQGNMAIFETIEDGLIAVQRSANYNTFGSSAPTRWNDASDELAPSESLPSIAIDINSRMLALANLSVAAITSTPQSPATSAPGGGTTSSPSKTSFGSKVDFNIAWGPSGGPSITTLASKLGGGANGASSLLNYTRTTVDSLTMTFGATCTSTAPLKVDVENKRSFARGYIQHANLGKLSLSTDVLQEGWTQGMPITGPGIKVPTTIASISKDGRTISLSQDAASEAKEGSIFEVPLIIAARESADRSRTYKFAVSLPHSVFRSSPYFVDGVFSTMSSTKFDILEVDVNNKTSALGTIQWTGTVYKDGEFNLRGMVSSGMSGQIVGQVFIKGDSSGSTVDQQEIGGLKLRLPSQLTANLKDDYKTASYWESVPSCDVITAIQKQSAIDSVAIQNQLQYLNLRTR